MNISVYISATKLCCSTAEVTVYRSLDVSARANCSTCVFVETQIGTGVWTNRRTERLKQYRELRARHADVR